ncbi:hypothetical protein HDU81_000680 [Chytriomyces hyalinus]|nr:hypothetical protein HDU81_000680 [Chytriomyces hyalinus]
MLFTAKHAIAALLISALSCAASNSSSVAVSDQSASLSTAPAIPATTLSVTGSGSVTLPSDCATIIVSIQKDGKSAIDAQRAASKITQDVFQILSSLKATRVSTNSVSISANYNYNDSPATITGFSAQTTISFQTTKDGAGPAVDACISRGISSLQSITFSANPSKYSSAANKAASNAVKDALNQANVAARPLKLCVSAIKSIDLNQQSQSQYYQPRMYMAAAPEAAPAGTTVQAGDVTATASASVVFELGTKCL